MKKNRIPLLGTVAVIVIAFAATAFLIERDDQSESEAKPLPPSETSPEGVGPLASSLPLSGNLAVPREALVRFLQAENWKERLPLIYDGDVLEKTIANYYREHNDHNFGGDTDLEFFHMEESVGPGKPYYIYFVTTPEVPEGFPVIVRRKGEDHLIDWQSFVEFHDHHFVDFEASPTAAAARLSCGDETRRILGRRQELIHRSRKLPLLSSRTSLRRERLLRIHQEIRSARRRH